MTSVEGEMGAQKFRFINSVEFLLIYLGTGEEQKRYVRAAKGFAKEQVGKLIKSIAMMLRSLW